MGKARVLVLCDYYLPGFRAGGPIRTIANVVSRFGDRYEFDIVTRNRDQGAASPFDLPNGGWVHVGKARVLYLSTLKLHSISWRRLVSDGGYDFVELNSLFSRISIRFMLWRFMRLLPRIPVLIAPRGELSEGALAIKNGRKRVYLCTAKAVGLYRGVVWHASTALEAADIRRTFRETETDVRVAPDLLPSVRADRSWTSKPKKEVGTVRVIALSRVCRMKNLKYTIQVLMNCCADVDLTIAGPAEDGAYWAECQSLLHDAKKNLRWRFLGEIPHDDVHRLLLEHHLFILPTLGENFGHVVVEALQAGCLALISDRTSWRDLEDQGVGWAVPLDDPRRYSQIVDDVAQMPNDEYLAKASKAAEYAAAVAEDADVVEQTRRLFDAMAGRRG